MGVRLRRCWRGERGKFGVAAGFSLYPTKNLGALGDAGVITRRTSENATRLKRLRQYGWEQPAISEEPVSTAGLTQCKRRSSGEVASVGGPQLPSTGNCGSLF